MTREDYLQAVLQLIQQSTGAKTGLRASTLGNLILRTLPEHWTNHGFSALKTLLQELQSRGVITVGPDAKRMLAIWITETPVAPQPKQPIRLPTTDFIRLRSEVWVAFVNSTPQGPRHMHRVTGVVRMGEIHPATIDKDWVSIPPISDECQKSWAGDVIDHFHLPEVRGVLNESVWYLSLAQKLQQARPDALTFWNRLRSTRVAEVVTKWCEQNSIPKSLVVESKGRDRNAAKVVSDESLVEPNGSMRQRILAALGRMPTHELLDIPIASKYLFASSQSDRP